MRAHVRDVPVLKTLLGRTERIPVIIIIIFFF